MIAAAASSISPRPPTQRKAARTSRAATADGIGLGHWAPSSGVVGEEVEHLVGAFDDGVDLAGGQPIERVIRFGQHDHAAHAVVQPLLRALLLDLGQRHRRGVGHRLADQAAVDLLVGRQRRLVAQQDLQEAEMRARACRAPAGRW